MAKKNEGRTTTTTMCLEVWMKDLSVLYMLCDLKQCNMLWPRAMPCHGMPSLPLALVLK